MKFIAAVLSLLAVAFASTAAEAAAIFKIEAADVQSQEIGSLIAPFLFQNEYNKVMKSGASRTINSNWWFRVRTSSTTGTMDHCSIMGVKQVIDVFPTEIPNDPDAQPSHTVTCRAMYDNVLESFDERARCRNHVYTMNNGSITVKPY